MRSSLWNRWVGDGTNDRCGGTSYRRVGTCDRCVPLGSSQRCRVGIRVSGPLTWRKESWEVPTGRDMRYYRLWQETPCSVPQTILRRVAPGNHRLWLRGEGIGEDQTDGEERVWLPAWCGDWEGGSETG